MGETYSDYINRNLGMAQGAAEISSNRTAKFTTQATRQLMPSGSQQPTIDQIISGDYYNHNGRDLTEVFTEEQLDYDTPWDWLQARIDAENFTGIMIGDYVPLEIDEDNWRAIVIGINTYKGFGTTNNTVGTHIDFFLVPESPHPRVFGLANNNNGIDLATPPWKTSDLYAWLNALKINVVSNNAVPIETTEKDYTETGFLLKLPEALQAKIVNRYGGMGTRNPSSALRNADTGLDWGDCGKLWLLSVAEVTSFIPYGNPPVTNTQVMYPYFLANNKRAQGLNYWLMNSGTNNGGFMAVSDKGIFLLANATSAVANTPCPCFRMAPTPPEPDPEP